MAGFRLRPLRAGLGASAQMDVVDLPLLKGEITNTTHPDLPLSGDPPAPHIAILYMFVSGWAPALSV